MINELGKISSGVLDKTCSVMVSYNVRENSDIYNLMLSAEKHSISISLPKNYVKLLIKELEEMIND